MNLENENLPSRGTRWRLGLEEVFASSTSLFKVGAGNWQAQPKCALFSFPRVSFFWLIPPICSFWTILKFDYHKSATPYINKFPFYFLITMYVFSSSNSLTHSSLFSHPHQQICILCLLFFKYFSFLISNWDN